MTENATLYVYQGEWGLPSIDFDCLRALCAVKFSNAPITINSKGNPFSSGCGRLPYIQNENVKIAGYSNIVAYLQEQGYAINDQLPRDIFNLSDAYECLVFNDLHPYFQYFMFGDPANVDTTRKIYANRTPFPFNFYYPAKYMKHADDVMQVFADFSVHDKIEFHATEMIVINAKKCINHLAKKLGTKKWFFGPKHSKFDILVYSYLSVLHHIKLTNNPLQAHLQECPNIVNFIERITKKYFTAEAYSSKDAKQTKSANGTNTSTTMTQSEHEFAASKQRTQILSAIGAVVAMSVYAAWMGIVKLTSDEPYYDDIEYDQDDDDEN